MSGALALRGDTADRSKDTAVTSSASARTLPAEWTTLWQRSQAGPFLSPAWIAAWLDRLPPSQPVRLFIRPGPEGRPAALALLAGRRRQLCGILPVWRWSLHESGNPELDRLALEDNGLLLDPAAAGDRTDQLTALLRDTGGEVCFGGVDAGFAADLERAADRAGYRVHCLRSDLRHWVDLDRVRAAGPAPAAWLSGSSGTALRRSIRLYEQGGPLVVEAARDVAEALRWLAALKQLHVRRWREEGHDGAFANPHFEPFHHRLIEDGLAGGLVELLRISAGGQDLGYLYNLCGRGWVHNYQCGFVTSADNRLKPGLTCHALAVARAAGDGQRAYDFLAGNSRYKRALATESVPMLWLSAVPDRWPWTWEAALRRLRARMAA